MYIHYIICEKKFWRSVCHAESVCFPSRAQSENFSLLSSEIFWPLSPPPKKKTFSLSKARECCVVTSDRLFSLSLFQRINQISLHLLSRRNSIALFYKGVFIYQNTVISVILLSSRHRRERESRKRKYSLSLKKRSRIKPKSTRRHNQRGRVCAIIASRENIFP